METPEVDVLIVGAGPAGASAAWRAADAGARVLLVDRRSEIGTPVQCAEFVPMPMLPYTRGDGIEVQRIEGMLTCLPSEARQHSPFPGLMIDRGAFDRALAAKAVQAGAVLWTSAHFDAWDGIEAQVRCGGRAHALRPRVLIGADGPRSRVADAVGLPGQEIVHTRQYTVPSKGAHADTDIFLSDDYPGGYGWLFPKGEVANLGIGADRRFESDLKAPLDALHRAMVERDRVGEDVLGRTGGAIPVGGVRSMVHGRVLLAGDAAGLTHPITGAGIAAAVVSGEAAGQAAATFLATGETGALTEYEEDMRDQFEPSLTRAVRRRAELARIWRSPAARQDAAMRRGWIAFDEYFAQHRT